jgi:hypothetical protein
MASKKLNSYGEQLTKAPMAAAFKTANNDILFIVLNATDVEYILYSNFDDTAKKFDVVYTDKTSKIFRELNDIFVTIFTQYKDYEVNDETKKKTFPAGLIITEDCNKTFFDKSFKVLSFENTLQPDLSTKKLLDNIGATYPLYTPTELSIDNSCSLDLSDNEFAKEEDLPEDLKPSCADTSSYKSYTMTMGNQLEMFLRTKSSNLALLIGEAGTGKSTDPLIWAAQNNVPVIVYNVTKGMEVEDLLTSKDIQVQDGQQTIVTLRGPLAKAAPEAVMFVINELTLADPGTQQALMGMTDDNRMFVDAKGNVIHVHPNFKLIATMNPSDFAGNNPISQALVDRAFCIVYPEADKKTLVRNLKASTGYKNERVIEAVVDAAVALKNDFTARCFKTQISNRGCKKFIHLLVKYPKAKVEDLFSMAFTSQVAVNGDLGLDEMSDLNEVVTPLIESIKAAISLSSGEEVKAASFNFSPNLEIDDLDSLSDIKVNDDGSYSL